MDSSRDQLIQLCVAGMKSRGIYDERHKSRFKEEMREVDAQGEHEYFLDLQDTKFPRNENNLLIAYVLGLVDDLDFDSPPNWIEGEYPDIDCDFIPVVQDYLRNDWAPRKYGRQNVCNIGNYATFGIKMSLIDMARVFGEDRNEVLALTTRLGLKDNDGKDLSFDKAIELSEEFKKYCEIHPDVAKAAKRIVGRIRGRGKHAGGTIISSSPIYNTVPIMLDTDGNPVSGWTEGLAEQDLQPVGYIKFDVLSIKDLLRIAEIVRLVKERHKISSIYSLQGQSDWTNIDYLNDPAALELADQGKTRGIFQFNSDGMRRLLKEGGVKSFDDLAAYTALFRPGPLGMKMHERFIQRKRGGEHGWENEVPDILKPILMNTYGVMVYQEQVMKILHVVGDIPLIHCEKVRKAISKKDASGFGKYKTMFILNGQRNLGWSEERVDDLWLQIQSFSEYGFNLSHAVAYTYISSRLLYLKTYYPLEFFTVTLRMELKDSKLWIYKRDAERMNIDVCPVELNKSGYTYNIIGDKIYTGYSNIKGIGLDAAKRIDEGQPYKDIQDFLMRFGTDAKVLKPLIMLGLFEGDRAILWAFYEEFKDMVKKRKDRKKRQFKTREKLTQNIYDLMDEGIELPDEAKPIFQHELLMGCSFGDDSLGTGLEAQGVLSKGVEAKDIDDIVKKYQKSVGQWEKKEQADDEKSFCIDDTPDSLEEMPTIEEAEKQFYGFTWIHPLEKSPDYVSGKTFEDQFEEKDGGVLPVEVLIWKPPRHLISRKKKPYYHVYVEDADRRQEAVTFWEEDFLRFEEEVQLGNLLSMRVERPSKGFSTFKFDSPPRHMRKSRIPEDKEDDYRIRVLNPPVTEDILDSLKDE